MNDAEKFVVGCNQKKQMKTAKQAAADAVVALSEFHIVCDPVLFDGKSLLEILFEQFGNEQWQKGMTDAAEITKRMSKTGSQDETVEAILAARDARKE